MFHSAITPPIYWHMPGEPPPPTKKSAKSRNKLWLRQYIGEDVLYPPILLALRSPAKNLQRIAYWLRHRLLIKLYQAETAIRSFTESHDQISNNPRSLKSQTEAQFLSPSRIPTPQFFFTIYLY
jgi:hypothetical protein